MPFDHTPISIPLGIVAVQLVRVPRREEKKRKEEKKRRKKKDKQAWRCEAVTYLSHALSLLLRLRLRLSSSSPVLHALPPTVTRVLFPAGRGGVPSPLLLLFFFFFFFFFFSSVFLLSPFPEKPAVSFEGGRGLSASHLGDQENSL